MQSSHCYRMRGGIYQLEPTRHEHGPMVSPYFLHLYLILTATFNFKGISRTLQRLQLIETYATLNSIIFWLTHLHYPCSNIDEALMD